jgi:hypothetical protein
MKPMPRMIAVEFDRRRLSAENARLYTVDAGLEARGAHPIPPESSWATQHVPFSTFFETTNAVS